ncbi:hypothetical protein DM02DRAFT_494154, partial [Periconia macrospinosa]
YRSEQYDEEFKYYYEDADEKSETLQHLLFQNAGARPMERQANNFFRYAAKQIQYGLDRY